MSKQYINKKILFTILIWNRLDIKIKLNMLNLSSSSQPKDVYCWIKASPNTHNDRSCVVRFLRNILYDLEIEIISTSIKETILTINYQINLG